jgi:tyrosyl-tRNA synthetase
MLTGDEVRANAETYMKQFFHVVDKSKTEVRWQSEWFDKFSLADTVRLAARFTVAQLLQREDFRSRYEAKKPLGIHELFYPLLQAYDSVAINADVEFGGTDQLFNLLVGRELQQEVGQHPQICVTMRLLVGTDGAQKMSKSLGNTVDLEDPPLEKYGKLMSIPDDAILDYLELATDISDEELVDIGGRLKSKLGNPMDVKKRLARDVITQFHGEDAAQDADREWARVYSGHEEPARVDEFRLPLSRPSESDLSEHSDGSWRWSIVKILVRAGLASSNSEARRLLRANAVEIDGEVQGSTSVVLHHGATFRVGKHRFLRIVDADGIDEAS